MSLSAILETGLDPENPPTRSHVVRVVIADGGIAVWCKDCPVLGAWPIERAEMAAERVRAHHEFCEAR